MLEIPKIVRQRLASGKSEAHPDANLLTAFAEETLLRGERDSVLKHLSRCSECREVLFLAAPQVEIETEVVPARSSWMRSSVLRWGALAACGVVVVAAVSLRQRSNNLATSHETPAEVGMKAEVPAASQKVAVELQKDRATMDYKSRADVVKPDERVFNIPQRPAPKARAAQMAAAPPRPETGASGSLVGGAVAARDLRMFAKPAPPAAAVPAPAADQVQVMAESAAVVTDKTEANLGKAKQALQANLPAENKVAKLESPVAAASGVGSLFKKVTPRWTLSADGTLQRSLDGGKTWKTIPVAADATLTAVAAMDSDIWVGGSHGSLYHSTDAGDHWAQIAPASAGQSLTANVIGIEFNDTLHGKITTADQEVWTTADGGQSWQLSP
jgi:hypothetical protein